MKRGLEPGAGVWQVVLRVLYDFWCPWVLTAMQGTGSMSEREVELRLLSKSGTSKVKA